MGVPNLVWRHRATVARYKNDLIRTWDEREGGGGGGGPAPWPGKIVRIRISVYFDKTVSRRSGELGRRDLIGERLRKTIPKADEPTRFSEPHENVHVHEKGEKRGRNFKRWLLISS